MARQAIILVGFDYDSLDLIETNQHFNLLGYTDKKNHQQKLPYLGNDKVWEKLLLEDPFLKAIISVDDTTIRKKMAQFYNVNNLMTVISPLAYVSDYSHIDEGCLIQHGVKIMPEVKIGKNCLLNVNATIHHESFIGSHSILAPGAHILGRVNIEDEVYIGAGAIIKQNCKIGKGSIIGAGAVVINDIPENSIVVGVPATKYLTTRSL